MKIDLKNKIQFSSIFYKAFWVRHCIYLKILFLEAMVPRDWSIFEL